MKMKIVFGISVLIFILTVVMFYQDSHQVPDEYEVVTFTESTDYISNPFMGAVSPASKRTRYVEGTIVVAGYSWNEIEREKGIFDFSEVEEKFNYHYWIAGKMNQYMLMLTLDYPTLTKEIGYEHIDIPLWMYEELKKEAKADYTRQLNEARRTGDQQAVQRSLEALDRIINDGQVIDAFNANMEDTADIPGVGTFYRWSMDVPGGVEYRGGFSPNYASPLLLQYHNRALSAIADRYDHAGTYAMIMGSLGHWGEMHTYFIQKDDAVGRYPPKVVASQYEQQYADLFKETLVSVRYPREVALENNFGLHHHALGSEEDTYDYFKSWYENGYVDYYTGDSHPAMPDFWKNAPVGAELLYTGDQRYLKDDRIEKTIQMAKDIHLTWMIEAFFNMDEETEVNQELFFSKIGYRFVIKKAGYATRVKKGSELIIETIWENEGTAPFYKDWPIILQIKDTDGTVVSESTVEESVRNLFPEKELFYTTSIEIPRRTEKGEYELFVGIFNPDTMQPAISLAVENMHSENHMHRIGFIEIR